MLKRLGTRLDGWHDDMTNIRGGGLRDVCVGHKAEVVMGTGIELGHIKLIDYWDNNNMYT